MLKISNPILQSLKKGIVWTVKSYWIIVCFVDNCSLTCVIERLCVESGNMYKAFT